MATLLGSFCVEVTSEKIMVIIERVPIQDLVGYRDSFLKNLIALLRIMRML